MPFKIVKETAQAQQNSMCGPGGVVTRGATGPDKPHSGACCYHVTTCGLRESCNVRPIHPHLAKDQLSGYPVEMPSSPCSIFVCNSALPRFHREMMHRMPAPFVLVSGDSNETMPFDVFQEEQVFWDFLENPKLVHWFCQNCVITHRKITPLPVGPDYTLLPQTSVAQGSADLSVRDETVLLTEEQERKLLAIKGHAVCTWDRPAKVYVNVRGKGTEPTESDKRSEAHRLLPPEVVVYDENPTIRSDTWSRQAGVAFVACPEENDCHLTWEALCLGCIAIVKRSALDAAGLYEGLPVLVVESWSDVTERLLESTLCEWRSATFCYQKLTLAYWTEYISSSSSNFVLSNSDRNRYEQVQTHLFMAKVKGNTNRVRLLEAELEAFRPKVRLFLPIPNPFLPKELKPRDEAAPADNLPSSGIRCAIIFHGLVKHFKNDVWPLVRQNICSRLPGQCDIFAHTYDLTVFNANCANGGQQCSNKALEAGCELHAHELHCANPITVEVQNQNQVDAEYEELLRDLKRYPDVYFDKHASLRNCIRGQHSMERGMKLVEQHEAAHGFRYSIICSTRADVLYIDPLPDECVSDLLEATQNAKTSTEEEPDGVLWIPDWGEYRLHEVSPDGFNISDHGGANDKFAIGSRNALRKWASRTSIYRDYSREKGPWHCETFMAWHILRQNLSVRKMHFRFLRVRANRNVEDGALLSPDEKRLLFTSEEDNRFFSARGLLKSCDIHSRIPQSSVPVLQGYHTLPTKPGSIYVCSAALGNFIRTMLPRLTVPFVLVTGDSYLTIPHEVFPSEASFTAFISNEKLLHWFAQNLSISHPKITSLPLGIDYHTMTSSPVWGPLSSCAEQEQTLLACKARGKPFWEREVKCYSNWHFSVNGENRASVHRKEAMELLDPAVMEYESQPVPRKESWDSQVKFAFVVSPHGVGLDCHRTWEALVLGCIPVVKRSVPGIDVLYENLPVLIVESWADVTPALLKATILEMKDKTFCYEQMTLPYWISRIRDHCQSPEKIDKNAKSQSLGR
jgi:hypothetical protein